LSDYAMGVLCAWRFTTGDCCVCGFSQHTEAFGQPKITQGKEGTACLTGCPAPSTSKDAASE
jgi:hypothetical protein